MNDWAVRGNRLPTIIKPRPLVAGIVTRVLLRGWSLEPRQVGLRDAQSPDARRAPVAESTSTIVPHSRTSFVATSNSVGRPVSVVSSTRSIRRPMMLSNGPVMPTSH